MAAAPDSSIWTSDQNASTNAVTFAPQLIRFREQIAGELPADAAETRLALAGAYKELGLHLEAIGELVMVVRSGRTDRVAEALQLLLSPPLLKQDGLDRLRSRLKGN